MCLWVGLCVCKPTSLAGELRLSDPQQHPSSLRRARNQLTGLGDEACLGFLEARIYLKLEVLRGVSQRKGREREEEGENNETYSSKGQTYEPQIIFDSGFYLQSTLPS